MVYAGRSGQAHCLKFTDTNSFILGGQDLIQVWRIKVRTNKVRKFEVRTTKMRKVMVRTVKVRTVKVWKIPV